VRSNQYLAMVQIAALFGHRLWNDVKLLIISLNVVFISSLGRAPGSSLANFEQTYTSCIIDGKCNRIRFCCSAFGIAFQWLSSLFGSLSAFLTFCPFNMFTFFVNFWLTESKCVLGYPNNLALIACSLFMEKASKRDL